MTLSDAGSGTGTWQVVRVAREARAGASLVLPASVEVPGALPYELVTTAAAAQGVVSGYIELRRAGDVRRIPYWGRVAVAGLARHRQVALRRVGLHRATTAGRPAHAIAYRYPENPRGLDVTTVLRGPELVYRFRLTKRVANFGVVVTQRATGSAVEPRVVAGMDENRLTGYAGLPIAHNPYLDEFRRPVLAAGALSPLPGDYGIVFDSATRAGAGRFTFRFWVDDVRPPTLRVRTRIGAARRPRAHRRDGRRLRGLSRVGERVGRRRQHLGVLPRGRHPRLDRRARSRPAPAPASRLRPPGDEEHGERGAHPPEHADADRDLHGPGLGRCAGVRLKPDPRAI